MTVPPRDDHPVPGPDLDLTGREGAWIEGDLDPDAASEFEARLARRDPERLVLLRTLRADRRLVRSAFALEARATAPAGFRDRVLEAWDDLDREREADEQDPVAPPIRIPRPSPYAAPLRRLAVAAAVVLVAGGTLWVLGPRVLEPGRDRIVAWFEGDDEGTADPPVERSNMGEPTLVDATPTPVTDLRVETVRADDAGSPGSAASADGPVDARLASIDAAAADGIGPDLAVRVAPSELPALAADLARVVGADARTALVVHRPSDTVAAADWSTATGFEAATIAAWHERWGTAEAHARSFEHGRICTLVGPADAVAAALLGAGPDARRLAWLADEDASRLRDLAARFAGPGDAETLLRAVAWWRNPPRAWPIARRTVEARRAGTPIVAVSFIVSRSADD